MCVSSPLFLMLLFELIGSVLGKQAHAQRAGEASADTHQSDRRPCSPPLCRATSQDRPLTTTMLIEDLIRRPGLSWQRLPGRDGPSGHGAGPRVPCSKHSKHTLPSPAACMKALLYSALQPEKARGPTPLCFTTGCKEQLSDKPAGKSAKMSNLCSVDDSL